MTALRKRYPMKSDVKEKDDRYILEIDLPGFHNEDIKAYIQDGYLIVSAVKAEERDKKKGKYIRQERYWGTYQRSFFIGKDISQEDIKAAYKHGVLKLMIPKEPQQKALPESSIFIAG